MNTKLDQQKLLGIMSDIEAQPDWRSVAKKCCAYYDNDQLPKSLVAKLKERGQPLTIHNLIAPTIDGVLGMEAKTRTDLLVQADDPDEAMETMAEAINAAFADAARLGRLDKARGEAYASQVKTGIGWVEVYRNPNPMGAQYRIKCVPRDEVFWDWFSTEHDLSDARWLLRRRWTDVDSLINMFPNKREVIEHAANGWTTFIDTDHLAGVSPDLVNAYQEYESWSREDSEWMSSQRNRVRLQIIYYRTVERKEVIRLSDGRTIEYQADNPLHIAAVGTGKARLEMGQLTRVIESWYAGPHFLGSKQCDAPGGLFPLVPFWGYRKDSSGEPYGLIARALPAQDEVNFRRIKLTWLLQAKRVIMDKDATDMPRNKVMEEVERPDGLIELNPNRKNQKSISEVFQVQQDFNIAAQQFKVMEESMRLIQDTMGVYGAFLGQESNASSGVAIANLVEQGATTLAEINDNYSFGSQLVGELLLGYIMEDLKGAENHAVVVNRDDKTRRKTVVLNEKRPEGLNNDLTKLRTHIALAPIQQTAAYKAQLAERMMQVTAQLPPQVQATVIDLVLELSDVPNKPEFMDRVRKALDVPKDPEDMTPEEQQAAEQQAEQQQQQMALAMREMAAKVEKLEAEAEKLKAAAAKEQGEVDSQRFDNAKTQAETGKILAEMEKLKKEIDALEQQYLQTINQEIDNIQLGLQDMSNDTAMLSA